MNVNPAPPLFIRAMLRPGFYPHPVKNCELVETHISWVILTGEYAYKIKKPVNFGFLDFSSLEKRKFYCEEELRLNSRLAPDIYLAVIAICGDENNPVLDDDGPAFDYAVKMKQFPREIELDHVLQRAELSSDMIDAIAKLVANFHHRVEIASADSGFGKPDVVLNPVQENFSQVKERIKDKATLDILSQIEQWSEATFKQLDPIFSKRKQDGFIRECHGDLHLRNLAWYQDKPLAFDCLEFNPNFRWIDVISEIAFLIMDLEDHQQDEFAQRFLNQYLEITGDYAGCRVLRFYLVYRAMVRAKVAAIRSQQGISKGDKDTVLNEFNNYLQLALNYTQDKKPFVLITRGVSGSGKSTITAPLSEKQKAIRLRSDVERKHLFNIKPEQDCNNEIAEGIYSKEATEKTYQELLELADTVLASGYPVIIDATFSSASQRQLFKALAEKSKCRFIILEFVADKETLQQRILERQNDVSDADLNVLNHQLEHWQALNAEENAFAFTLQVDKPVDIDQLIKQLSL